jgi:hypothetical protein
VLEIKSRAQCALVRPHHDLMAERPTPINQQVGQQPRSINQQVGQQPHSINQQVGQQPHQRQGAAVRQEDAQDWPSAGNA